MQATPKRLVGILKKEFVIGVAASRYHCAVFTADTLFTWGKNNGQLGYPSNATPIQHSPRKVTSLQAPPKQVSATEVATVCLLEGGDVFVLHRDSHFRISFPMTRFPSAMQVYRPPNVSSRPTITKVAGSSTTFIAISSMGDLFSWQLDNPALEVPLAPFSTGRDIKPTRIWEDRKTFTAVTDAAIANDTIIITTRSGHVYVRSRKKELNAVKGFELRGSGGPTGQLQTTRKTQYKFSKVSNLQRIVNVTVSPSGGFGALRSDAPLLQIPAAGETLSESMSPLLPHYQRFRNDQSKSMGVITMPFPFPPNPDEADEAEDVSIEQDKVVLSKLCMILERWNSDWSTPAAGADILVVAGSSGVKIPAHSTILAARSSTLARALQGHGSTGIIVSRVGTTTLLLPKCGHVSALLLLHYLYADDIPAIYDPRLFPKLRDAYPQLGLDATAIKSELQSLASVLQLPALERALGNYGKALPPPSLSEDMRRLLDSKGSGDIILEADGQDFCCHSVLLRSRCPFFEAIFNDPDWYSQRTLGLDGEHKVVRIDLRHIRSDVLAIILQTIYTDGQAPLYADRDFGKADEKIDFLMLILSASNELLLDGLKALCSAVIRPLSKAHSNKIVYR